MPPAEWIGTGSELGLQCFTIDSSQDMEQPVQQCLAAGRRKPFYCDYSSNIFLGTRCFFNFNCVVLDVCEVHIGDYAFFGPAVQIYTATHPMEAELRRTQEFAKPIEIADGMFALDG